MVAVDAAVKARVVDGHRHARGDQPQQRAIVLGVGVEPRGLHVDHAHQLLPRDHGDSQFRAYRVDRAQVARVVADVAHQHRLAPAGGRARDTVLEGERQVVDDLGPVPDGETDTQLLIFLRV